MVSESESCPVSELALRVLVVELDSDGIGDSSVSDMLSWCRSVVTMIGTVTVTRPSSFLFTKGTDGALLKRKHVNPNELGRTSTANGLLIRTYAGLRGEWTSSSQCI